MAREKTQEELELELARYRFENKQKIQILWLWYIGLLFFALLGPCVDIPSIYPLAGLACAAAFISMLLLISMKMWKHLIIGLIAFVLLAGASEVYDKHIGIAKESSSDDN